MKEKKCVLAGIGMGNPDMLTIRTLHMLEDAPVIAGEKRLLDSLPDTVKGKRISSDSSDTIPGIFESYYSSFDRTDGIPCAVFSGDTGFYSGADSLVPVLKNSGYTVCILPGITTAQYLASRLECPWHGWRIISEKTDPRLIGAEIGRSMDTLFLTGTQVTPEGIIQFLAEHGAGSARVTVGENLSYHDEKITTDTAVQLCQSIKKGSRVFSPLAAVLVERSFPDSNFGPQDLQQTCGFPDDFFIRTAEGEKNIAMTKQEIRSVIMAKLALRDGDVFYDIGAGTGSVSVEAALSCHCSVYAIEENAAACALIKRNRAKAGASNIEIVQKSAPAAFCSLPPADAVFIGGSHDDAGPNLTAIITGLYKKNPAVRILVSALNVETAAAASTLPECEPEIVQLSVSRSRRAGKFHVFSSQNPVFLFYFCSSRVSC